MATLQASDGRLLRSSRPSGSGWGLMPSTFPPMWSSGEREGDTVLASYANIYRSQAVVAGVVDKLAKRISTLPFCAYQRVGEDGSRQVRGDALDSLLRRPQPRSTGVHLLHHIAQSLLIHGNALVAMLRGPDREEPPVMLWPLDWSQVGAYGEDGGRIEWWSTYQFGREERFISTADTLHFAWPSPEGGEVGVSPLQKLSTAIKLEDAAQRYQVAQFANGNRPSLAITLDHPNPKKDLLDLTRASIENLHKGVDRSGRTILLGAGAKVEPLSLSPVEAALVEQRHLDWEEIGMVYDLPGPLMGDLRYGTYNNTAEFLASLYRDVVPPWLALIEQTFGAQLIDQQPGWLDRFVEFDLTDKLKGDPAELATTLKLQVEAGLITRNEARRILNMEPAPDPEADKLSANVNNQATLASMGDGQDADVSTDQTV